MNFEDEEYVRIYTRDTNTIKKIGWEGRLVLWSLIRKADCAGVIDLDEGDDLVESVAALIDVPEDIVRVGLERLASRSVTERHGGPILLPKHVEAQNAKRSDRLRAQDYRDRQRAKNTGIIKDASHDVTGRHDSSLPALPSPALPCPALPKNRTLVPAVAESGNIVQRDTKALAEAALRDPQAASLQVPPVQDWPEVIAVCEAFATTWGRQDKPRHQGDPRARAILGRLAEGYTVNQLIQAVRGSKFADYIADNPANQALKTILRDAAQIDKFGSLTAPAKPLARGRVRGGPPQPDHGKTGWEGQDQ